MGEYPAAVSAYREALDTWEDELDALEDWYNAFFTAETQTYETVLQETVDRIPQLADRYKDAYDLHAQEIADLKEELELVVDKPGYRHTGLPGNPKEQKEMYEEIKDLNARYGMLKERQKYLGDLADDKFDMPLQEILDEEIEQSLMEQLKQAYHDMTAEEKVAVGFTTLAIAGLLGEELRQHAGQ